MIIKTVPSSLSGKTCPPPRPPFGRKRPGLVLALSCLLAAAGLASAGAQPTARPDHFESIDALIEIAAADLLANDDATAQASIKIAAEPRRGSLRSTADGFAYQPDEPFFGVDVFSYELLDGGELSGHAAVTIRFVLESQPLAGRWPTPTCNDVACPASCDDGRSFELGWYHRDIQVFQLCDWQGESGIGDCVDYQVPFAVASGGTPLIIDWDDDGWDEPALQDWSNDRVLLFEDSGAPCPGEEKGRCLALAKVHDLAPSLGASNRHAWPAAQRWMSPGSTGGSRDVLSAYDSLDGQLHQAFDGSAFSEAAAFDHGLGSVAVIGDWLGGGVESIGIWNHGHRSFSWWADHLGSGVVDFEPGLSEDFLRRAWPFAAPRDGCGSADLGLYNPCRGEIYLRDVGEPDPERGSTYVNIPTDPEGYPKPWPQCLR